MCFCNWNHSLLQMWPIGVARIINIYAPCSIGQNRLRKNCFQTLISKFFLIPKKNCFFVRSPSYWCCQSMLLYSRFCYLEQLAEVLLHILFWHRYRKYIVFNSNFSKHMKLIIKKSPLLNANPLQHALRTIYWQCRW